MQSGLALFLVLVAAVPCGGHAALRGPYGDHSLSADGASVAANPEIDAWHAAEKAKIEEECNDMMRQLTAEKRQKLQDIVDAARKQVDLERDRLAKAQGEAADELKDLEDAKAEAQKKARKPRMGPTRDSIGDLQKRIAELEKLIAEKKACIDELAQAQKDLLDAQKKLKEAQKMVAEAEKKKEFQRAEIMREEGDIPPAEQDLELAEADLANAKAIHAAAARRLKHAKDDLAEHDAEGSYSKYTSMDLDMAEPRETSLDLDYSTPKAPAAPEVAPTKSGASRAAATAAAALLAAALFA